MKKRDETHFSFQPSFLNDNQIRKLEIDALKAYVRRRIGGYKVAAKQVTTDNLLYRGVPWQDRPTRIDQLWHPPPEKVSKKGRVNDKGTSMFYCSRGAPPVIYEIRAETGDRIALSEWSVVEPFWCHHLGFDDALMQAIGAPSRRQLQGLIPDEMYRNKVIRRKLSLPFTEVVEPGDEYCYRYKQTIAIHKLLFDDANTSEPVAGTAYPSMGMLGHADNIALWPEYVPKVLRPKSVRYLRIESADPESHTYSVKTLAVATSFSGDEIEWHAVAPDDAQSCRNIALEGNSWVVRDGSGRICEFH